MIATLGGLTFVGDGTAGTYTLTRITGWWGGVEMRHEKIPRPNADGDFDSPGFLGGRVVTLEGFVETDSDAAFETALADLDALLADGSSSELSVTQALGTYAIQVRRHGSADVDMIVYGHTARYQLQLWAPDPAKELVP